MRIGLITPGFSASEDDWCIPALLDLVRVLAEGDEVTVFALRYPHRRETYAVHGAAVRPTGGAERGGLARLPILLRTLARVVRQARRRPFDVLHALWAHEPGFVAALAGRMTATPVLVSFLGGELADLPEIDYGGGRSRANRWLAARALTGADRVSVGSRYLRRLAERHVPAEKLFRHPLGVDTGRFHPGSAAEEARLDGDPVLLNVASLSSVKDHRTLLAAFALLAEPYPGARLHLLGEGELEREIAERARELDVRDRLVLHGAVDHGRLASYYARADLALQSSRFESQGMAVLEAAACGCPVAGTAVGVLPELCLQRAIAPPGDAEALAAAAAAVLGDRRFRERLRKAQAAEIGRFELGETVGQLRRRYQGLVAGRE